MLPTLHSGETKNGTIKHFVLCKTQMHSPQSRKNTSSHHLVCRRAVQPISKAPWGFGKIHREGARLYSPAFDASLDVSTKDR